LSASHAGRHPDVTTDRTEDNGTIWNRNCDGEDATIKEYKQSKAEQSREVANKGIKRTGMESGSEEANEEAGRMLMLCRQNMRNNKAQFKARQAADAGNNNLSQPRKHWVCVQGAGPCSAGLHA
jgi:hypothetical protein